MVMHFQLTNSAERFEPWAVNLTNPHLTGFSGDQHKLIPEIFHTTSPVIQIDNMPECATIPDLEHK